MKVVAYMVHKNDETKTRVIPIEIESLKMELAKDVLRGKDLLIFNSWILIEIKEMGKPFKFDKNKLE